MMKQKLIADYALLEKQLFWLDISYTQCSRIGISFMEIDRLLYFPEISRNKAETSLFKRA